MRNYPSIVLTVKNEKAKNPGPFLVRTVKPKCIATIQATGAGVIEVDSIDFWEDCPAEKKDGITNEFNSWIKANHHLVKSFL